MRKRWTLLEHTGAPKDPLGIHFDLLLEAGLSCKTWRLDSIPVLDGPVLVAVPLPLHKLEWLDRESAPVSGNRGWAKRLFSGFFIGELSLDQDALVKVQLLDGQLNGRLEIQNGFCKLQSFAAFDLQSLKTN